MPDDKPFDWQETAFDLLMAGELSSLDVSKLCGCSRSFLNKLARKWRGEGHVFPITPRSQENRPKSETVPVHMEHGILANGGDIWAYSQDQVAARAAVRGMGGVLDA